ncbi:MAG: acyl-CoA dehydrogenase family protein, partial [Caldisphaera sp.]|nr:acyl-CoA dehydrogenase family protein [Caldisphaera sp.]
DFLEKMKKEGLFSLRKYGLESLYHAVRLTSRYSPAIAHIIMISGIGSYKLGLDNSVFSTTITEPGGGTDVKANLKTIAEENQEGSAIINGEKIFGSNALYATHFIILAQGPQGPTLYLAERQSNIKVKPMELISFRGAGICQVFYENTKAKRVGQPGKGLREALELINYGRLGYGSIGLGISESILNELGKSAISKKIFGKELSEYQSVKWMFAEIETKIRLLELFINKALEKIKNSNNLDPLDAAISKVIGAEIAQRATWIGVQLLGGKGLSAGTLVERLARDSRVLDIGEGAREVLLDYIGEQAIKLYK